MFLISWNSQFLTNLATLLRPIHLVTCLDSCFTSQRTGQVVHIKESFLNKKIWWNFFDTHGKNTSSLTPWKTTTHTHTHFLLSIYFSLSHTLFSFSLSLTHTHDKTTSCIKYAYELPTEVKREWCQVANGRPDLSLRELSGWNTSLDVSQDE